MISYTYNQLSFLKERASRYVWWKKPSEAIQHPHLVLAQMMNLCTWDDFRDLQKVFSKDELIDLLSNAEIGLFRPQSWNHWWIKLTKCRYDDIPPMPKRNLG
jgi:hypothetical protein